VARITTAKLVFCLEKVEILKVEMNIFRFEGLERVGWWKVWWFLEVRMSEIERFEVAFKTLQMF
jgi:hypothetical protein